MINRLLGLALAVLCPTAAFALGPHEILLLVNRNSAQSAQVAGEFARMRSVPDSNVVQLDIPERLLKPAPACSAAEFARYIWTPATNASASRGISDHILAWVYSVDFPVKIRTSPPISITGLTFARNKVPDSELVDTGRYRSVLFAGPDSPASAQYPPQSFDVARAWLGNDMPLPSMMLGYTGERGSTVDSALACIRRGVIADGTRPAGSIFFITGTDVRARAREWEFAAVQGELSSAGIKAVITNGLPGGNADILGILAGSPEVIPASYGRYVPGCFADHLTSAAADFEGANQTKMTAWIDAGAIASAGTVTEPRAIWTKFPHARLFVHSAAGCTMIESLFQSIRSPMQILPIGDPLCAPWAPRDSISLEGPWDRPLHGVVPMCARVRPEAGRAYSLFVFMVDGRIVSRATVAPRDGVCEATLSLETAKLVVGEHALRAVAYLAGSVRGQVFVEKRFVVENETGQ